MRRLRKGNGGFADELRRSDTPAGPVPRNSLSAFERAARECKPAIYGKTPRKPYSAKAQGTQRSCLSASNPEIVRMWQDIRSLAPRGSY